MTEPANALRTALVVYAKDKDRLAAFYRRTLGVLTVAEGTSYVVLRANDVELVLHSIPAHIAAQIEITVPPAARQDTPLKPSFLVRSLTAVREHAVAAGGFVNGPESEWRFGDSVCVDGFDPEGNVVQFREHVD